MPRSRSGDQQGTRSGAACRLLAVAVLGIAALLSTNVHSAPGRPPTKKLTHLASEGQAKPTAAWMKFCTHHPAECAVDRTEPEFITLTPQVLATVASINQHVNATIAAVADQEHWGVQDRWDYPDDGKGDCEDIQLLKRKLLVEQGLPRRAMRMTVVINKKGEGHAVLMVRTSTGDLILDNARDEVLPWQRTGYEFVKREGSNGRSWVWLNGQHGPVVTAAR